MAKEHGLLSVADNTFATPFNQRPLDEGIDIVMHSATKYLNGHSDMIGGVAVTGREDLGEQLAFLQNSVGAIAGPFDSFLALRGLKTLALRMQRHNENGQAMAEWLEQHPKIERVIYPGLPSHPQYELAARQMRGFTGMVTAIVRGGDAAASRFLERLEVFALAESLGGVESLINHPAIMTHASVPQDKRAALGMSGSLVRFSVGIEDIDDLQRDVDQALRLMTAAADRSGTGEAARFVVAPIGPEKVEQQRHGDGPGQRDDGDDQRVGRDQHDEPQLHACEIGHRAADGAKAGGKKPAFVQPGQSVFDDQGKIHPQQRHPVRRVGDARVTELHQPGQHVEIVDGIAQESDDDRRQRKSAALAHEHFVGREGTDGEQAEPFHGPDRAEHDAQPAEFERDEGDDRFQELIPFLRRRTCAKQGAVLNEQTVI